jgi:pilus assembly protein FimV
MALLCANAWAGLGKINVRSNLGEPLRAEIPLSGADAAATKIGLAGADTFREFQVDYSGILSSLRFAIVRRGNGAVLRVTSSRPINEPFLRFVVEAQGNGNRSVREYTVLLDPPEYSAVRQPTNLKQDLPTYADEHLAQRYRGHVRDQLGGAGPATRPGELTATPGATLASLARRVQPGGVSLTQTMAALVQANPRAFINGNPHLLRQGAVLKVPPTVKIKAIRMAEAQSILAGQATAAPAAERKEASVKEPPTVPATTVRTSQATAGNSASGVLKLLPAGEANASTSARLSDLENQIAARDKTLKSAEDRIAALEAQLRSLQGGTVPPAVASSAPMAAPAPAAQASAPAHQAAPVVVAKPAHPAPVAPPKEEAGPSWTDRLLDNLPLIGGGAVAALLAALLGVRVVQRRRSGGAAKTAVVGVAARAPAVAAATTGHSFMSDFTRSFGEIDAGEVDPIAEAEVYIAYGRDEQAEEILKDALGRDPARHEVRMKLLEIYAGREDKESFERVAKELHAAFDGKGQLWAKAAALGQTVDPGNPLYQIVESPAPAVAPVAPIDPLGGMIDLDQELMGMQSQRPIKDQAAQEALMPDLAEPAAPSPQEEPQEDALRAALFGEGETKTEPAAPITENMLDFDLDSLAAEAAQSATQEEEKPPEASSNMLDFDFTLEEMPERSAAEPETPLGVFEPKSEPEPKQPAESPLGDFASLYDTEPEAPVSTSGITVSDDPLSTKLDLAKVYLDMGDSEGAREVLKELVEEAQGPLKDEAQALLTKLGG